MIAVVYVVGFVVLAAFSFVRAIDARIERERSGASFPTARTKSLRGRLSMSGTRVYLLSARPELKPDAITPPVVPAHRHFSPGDRT